MSMNILMLMERSGRGNNSGCTRKCNEDQIRMSLTHGTVPRKQTGLAFTIGLNLMTQMRWFIGDRVTIDFEPEVSCLLIRRVANVERVPSWMLCPRSDKAKGNCEIARGKTARAGFSMTATPLLLQAFGMDDREEYIPAKIVTSERGIQIPLPKQWTVHNKTK